jgi:phosphatidylinositol alpha 1,6-mannosyltransferase
LVNVRIAIVAESFLPDVNGVAHCTLRAAEHLVARGHQPLVIAPAPASGTPGMDGPFPCPVIRIRSVPVPGYRSFRPRAELRVPGDPSAGTIRGLCFVLE